MRIKVELFGWFCVFLCFLAYALYILGGGYTISALFNIPLGTSCIIWYIISAIGTLLILIRWSSFIDTISQHRANKGR